MKKTKGKIIILEGIDGSGKSTQHKLLFEYLRSKNQIVKTIKFPRHGKKFFGLVVSQYLANKFGPAAKIDAHIASILFALDRLEVRDKILDWLKKGYLVIPDRYTTSNLGHQLGKIINKDEKTRDAFISWDREMEYKYLQIPKPDLVIYLRVDFKTVTNLLKKRSKNNAHDLDLKYLKNSQYAYDYVCKKSKHWIKLNCMKNNEIMSLKQIHQKIIKIIKSKFQIL